MAVNSLGSLPSSMFQRPAESGSQKSKMAFTQKLKAGKSVNAKVSKQASNSAKLSAAASQFATRRQSDKNAAEEWSSAFERVLEEDGAAKAKSLLRIFADEHVSIEQLLRQARSLFPDDSDLVMVLRELLRQRTLSEKLKTLLKSMLKEVEGKANPRHLKAGINCGLKARLFGQKYLDLKPALLRASYRQFLDNEQHFVEDYQDWIACYGYTLRSAVIDFINAAISCDIDSQDPSCSSTEFGPLLSKLNQVRLLRSGDEEFSKKRLYAEVISNIDLPEPDWLAFYIAILLQPEAIGEHLNVLLAEKFQLLSHLTRAMFLQAIYRACQALPQTVFVDEESVPSLFSELQRLTSLVHHRERIAQRRSQKD